MITLFFLLAIFGLGHSLDEPPTRYEIETSINRTIDEVERMIREDSSLPRLTRSQIVDILFNITSKDERTYDNLNALNKTRTEYQRALMVVLPFDTKNSKENLKDLYTKPPIVQMVLDDSTTERFETIFENGTREELVYPEEPEEVGFSVEESLDNAIGTRFEGNSQLDAEEENEEWRNVYDNRKDINSYSEEEIVEPVVGDNRKQEASPEKISFNLENLEATEGINNVVTRHPVFEKKTFENVRDSVADSSKLEIVYSTRVTEVPMTRTTTEVFRDAPITSTTPPKTTQHILTSDQWHYNAPPVTSTEKPRKISSTYRDDPERSLFAATATTARSSSAERSSTTIWKPDLTMKIRGANDDNSLITTERPSPVYVTPMSPMTSAKSKYSSTYTLASGGFLTVTTTAVPMTEQVRDLLASIGLRSSKNDSVDEQQSTVAKPSHEIPDTNNVIYSQASGLAVSGVGSPSILSQNTFENSQSAFGKGVENLTPNVQLLFQRFGLPTSSKQQLQEAAATTTTTTTTTTRKPGTVVVNLNSYTNFKPLPTTKTVADKDMRDLLAKFGLGVSDNRSQKAMKARKSTREQPPSLTEVVPDGMKKILENIGLISRSQKSFEITSKTEQSLEPNVPAKLHVFKPHEASEHTEEQKEKIDKLLDTNGPDPLSLEEILKIYNEDVRNEVKRQENGSNGKEDDDPSLMSTASSETSSTTTETSSTSETSNLAALAESFGGTTQAPDPVLPTRRRSGLYFLVDWNTFLEVGEEGKDKVNLSFQPKVGDRTRFIPVMVP